jgi:hypothetical protein
MVDQVATAPCTDPIQVRFLLFEAKPFSTYSKEELTYVRVAGNSLFRRKERLFVF